MSVTCTFYEIGSGRYIKTVSAPDWDNIWINAEPGTAAIQGEYPEDTYLRSGRVTAMPPRPAGARWQFDLEQEQWVNLLAETERLSILVAARATAVLPKSELLTRMFRAGLLSMDDMLVASEGNIPAAIEPSLASLPLEDQAVARVKWRVDSEIRRNHPVVVLAGAALGATEQQLDDIFQVRHELEE